MKISMTKTPEIKKKHKKGSKAIKLGHKLFKKTAQDSKKNKASYDRFPRKGSKMP